MPTTIDDESGTDDVAGAARPAAPGTDAEDADVDPLLDAYVPGPDASAPPPAEVEELARACVRFVTTRYGIPLDYQPETLSFVD